MLYKRVMPSIAVAFAVACLAAVAWAAGDEPKGDPAPGDSAAKTPLQKIMIRMEDQTKAIQKVASSPARFKKAGSGKDIVPAAEELLQLGKDSRKFTEPAEKQKKPQKRWDEYTDQYIVASEAMIKVAKKKDYQEVRKALKALDLSCSNCHGLFRPKKGGDEFDTP